MVKDGAARCAASTASISAEVTAGNVARHGDHAAAALPARAIRAAAVTAAGMAVTRAVGHHPRAERAASAVACGIERDDHDAGKAGAGDSLQHFPQPSLRPARGAGRA